MEGDFEMTNRQFSKANVTFREACRLAKVVATVRQASKYAAHKGSAFKHNVEAFHNTFSPVKKEVK